eukprot:gene19363-6600_t
MVGHADGLRQPKRLIATSFLGALAGGDLSPWHPASHVGVPAKGSPHSSPCITTQQMTPKW